MYAFITLCFSFETKNLNYHLGITVVKDKRKTIRPDYASGPRTSQGKGGTHHRIGESQILSSRTAEVNQEGQQARRGSARGYKVKGGAQEDRQLSINT